jgi:hypothetical protein
MLCILFFVCRWQSPEDVELVQFMGKDNVPFHTVIFPASLLGSGRPWTMMKNISVTEYLNYEGGKFSKSRGTGECEVHADIVGREAVVVCCCCSYVVTGEGGLMF